MFKTHRRAPGRRGGRGVPAPRDGPGHLRQLQERAGQHARAGPVRHRPDRQELPQRDHAAELHLPLARVRADGDRVLLPPELVARVVPVLARPAATSGTSTWAWPATGCGCATTTPEELSHYSRGTADIEYAFPFLPPGEFGELEGIAHRGDFDLRSHMEGKLDEKTRPLRWNWTPTASRSGTRQRQGPDLLRRPDRASGSCRT